VKIKFDLRCNNIIARDFVLDTSKRVAAIGCAETGLQIFNIEIDTASITPVQGDCQHRWVSMKNEVIESGEYCPKCNAVRATP